MDQYVLQAQNPPGLRVSEPGAPSCQGCGYAVAGMADGHSGAMVCRARGPDIPVRQDFVCDLFEACDGAD